MPVGETRAEDAETGKAEEVDTGAATTDSGVVTTDRNGHGLTTPTEAEVMTKDLDMTETTRNLDTYEAVSHWSP